MLLVSCKGAKVTTDYKQHDTIVKQDLNNKQKELEILREIQLAQINNDEEAYKFFLQEYMDVPRLELTAEQKKHPLYKEWLSIDTIKSGAFADSKYDFIK